MNRILYISLSVILFISCGNKDREILVKLMQEWKGREILYPNDMHFFMQGRDTLNADSICMYKIITYIDSIGCMSCKLGLSQWQDFYVNLYKEYTSLKSRELEELPHVGVMSWQPFMLLRSASLCLFRITLCIQRYDFVLYKTKVS